jgi:hypothetical protein
LHPNASVITKSGRVFKSLIKLLKNEKVIDAIWEASSIYHKVQNQHGSLELDKGTAVNPIETPSIERKQSVKKNSNLVKDKQDTAKQSATRVRKELQMIMNLRAANYN